MPTSTGVASYWQAHHVSSPLLPELVPVIAALDVPYAAQENRLQSLNLYLPTTPENARLIGTPVQSLPGKAAASIQPRYYVHIHGGAWRDPQLSATSIEPTVAYAFAQPQASSPITAIASLNYTLTQFPTHPTLPYATGQAGPANPTREAVHPQHVHDALRGLALLRTLGMEDGSYLLSGHSCGACIAFEAILQAPQHYGLRDVADAPCPAALLGVNGLYDLPALVDKLGASHEHLRADYLSMLTNAFGPDQTTWPTASPACFAPATNKRAGAGRASPPASGAGPEPGRPTRAPQPARLSSSNPAPGNGSAGSTGAPGTGPARGPLASGRLALGQRTGCTMLAVK
jgi:kynurenine formamidase